MAFRYGRRHTPLVEELDPALDPPVWTVIIEREGARLVKDGIPYVAAMALYIPPLGVALNHGTVCTVELYRAGILRAELRTYPPTGEKRKEESEGPNG